MATTPLAETDESAALAAVMAEDEDEANRIIGSMPVGRRHLLALYAEQLSALARYYESAEVSPVSTEPIDLDALRRLESAATEAPWVAINTLDENSEWGSDFEDPMVVTEDSYPGAYSAIAKGICQGSTNGVADAEFIAAARNAMPALLAEVEHLRELARRWVPGYVPESSCSISSRSGA